MRKLNYLVATSLDGFVALPDQSFAGFEMEGPHVAHFLETVAEHDTVLMGRRTYEVGLKMGVSNPYPNLRTFVASRSLKVSPDPQVTLITDGLADFVRQLKQEDGKGIWLAGAGELASSLFAAGLIDTLSVKVNPFLMGQGIPLVARLAGLVKLELVESRPFENGVVTLAYRVAPR